MPVLTEARVKAAADLIRTYLGAEGEIRTTEIERGAAWQVEFIAAPDAITFEVRTASQVLREKITQSGAIFVIASQYHSKLLEVYINAIQPPYDQATDVTHAWTESPSVIETVQKRKGLLEKLKSDYTFAKRLAVFYGKMNDGTLRSHLSQLPALHSQFEELVSYGLMSGPVVNPQFTAHGIAMAIKVIEHNWHIDPRSRESSVCDFYH